MHATDLKNRLSRRSFVPGLDSRDKAMQMIEAFFDPAKPQTSFKEIYVRLTGDKNVTGRVGNCDQTLLREAIGSSSLPNVLGAAIGRRMIADYNDPNDRYSVFRPLVTIANAEDFRERRHVRVGGYGDLPAVGQGAPYAALQSPADETANYAITKRGGTETINIEAIKNDDVGLIRSVPKKLAHAAKRTLSKFVLDFLRTNPIIYDGVALFHASHGNLGNAALSAAAVAAGRAAMRRQTELSSGDPLPIEPRHLYVPLDLEETAFNLFRRTTNNDKTFVQDLSYDVHPVWYWTDVNDWCLSTDPGSEAPTIELAFLDGNEQPELFVQDVPTAGSLFSHDQITWKIRHIYGGAVIDYRGIYKSVVV